MKKFEALLLIVVLATPASGSLVTFEFRGTIVNAFSNFGDDVHSGDPFLASFTFESETVDSFPGNTSFGRYLQQAGVGITVSAGNASFYSSANTFSPSGGLNIDVIAGSRSWFVAQSGSGSALEPRIQIFLLNQTGLGFATDALPTSIELMDWKDAVMFVTGPSSAPGIGESAFRDVSGSIESFRVVSASVPELTSLAIWLLLGLVGAAVGSRRRRLEAA